MKEGDAVLYPGVSWIEKTVSLLGKEDFEIGVIIKKLPPARSGEVVYQVLKKDGTLNEYFDFELKLLDDTIKT